VSTAQWVRNCRDRRRQRRAEGLCADCGRLSGDAYHCRACKLRTAAQAQRERDRKRAA